MTKKRSTSSGVAREAASRNVADALLHRLETHFKHFSNATTGNLMAAGENILA